MSAQNNNATKKVWSFVTGLAVFLYNAINACFDSKDTGVFPSIIRALPSIAMIGAGLYGILNAISPPDDPSFTRWEVDDGSGTTVTVMGFTKRLGPRHILASGQMSVGTARLIWGCAGALFLVLGIVFLLRQFDVFAPRTDFEFAN